MDASKPIAEGPNGKVVKATHADSLRNFAVKIIYLADTSTEVIERAKIEADILKILNGHPNIIRVHDIFEQDRMLHIVMDYIDLDLLSYLSSFEGGLTENEASAIFKQILHVMKFMHKKKIVHGDIKLDNFLYDRSKQRVVLIDFGSASYLHKKNDVLHIITGTCHYVAPEVILEEEYNGYKSDVYSLGVLLFCLATNRLPFDDEDSNYYYSWVENYYDSLKFPELRMLPPVMLSSALTDLVQKMLCLDPKKRIPLEKIKREPWLQKCSPGLRKKEKRADIFKNRRRLLPRLYKSSTMKIYAF
eukprot:TRINITY_DN15310_c0_g1_i1.p1 TRINITY_DN15310_c0_g1~~TRINITY_DN15310_c0_g1_i1.p1  ORF type:complete len:333 (+),score=38.36 TRINITY_DN15310_c0_g1_i1:91-999(+)